MSFAYTDKILAKRTRESFQAITTMQDAQQVAQLAEGKKMANGLGFHNYARNIALLTCAKQHTMLLAGLLASSLLDMTSE